MLRWYRVSIALWVHTHDTEQRAWTCIKEAGAGAAEKLPVRCVSDLALLSVAPNASNARNYHAHTSVDRAEALIELQVQLVRGY